MIRDLIDNSQAMKNEPVIRMSDTVYDAMLVLRQFLYENVYRSARVHNEFVKAKKILSDLYGHFMENEPDLQAELAGMNMDGCNDLHPTRERLVCDLLASMTDRYAMAVYRRIFFPAPVV
jgi:dGTPase